jgi:hypothetical protein
MVQRECGCMWRLPGFGCPNQVARPVECHNDDDDGEDGGDDDDADDLARPAQRIGNGGRGPGQLPRWLKRKQAWAVCHACLWPEEFLGRTGRNNGISYSSYSSPLWARGRLVRFVRSLQKGLGLAPARPAQRIENM